MSNFLAEYNELDELLKDLVAYKKNVYRYNTTSNKDEEGYEVNFCARVYNDSNILKVEKHTDADLNLKDEDFVYQMLDTIFRLIKKIDTSEVSETIDMDVKISTKDKKIKDNLSIRDVDLEEAKEALTKYMRMY